MKNQTIIGTEDVLGIVTESLTSKIGERIKGYSSPLNQIVDDVIREHSETIKSITNSCLKETLETKEFRKAIKEEFAHKVAKTMVSKLEGAVEKSVDILRQNPTLRAQMILAIENIIQKETNPHE